MTDQQYLEFARKYIWKSLLWKNQNGYRISFEIMYDYIKRSGQEPLPREYRESLGSSYSKRKAEIARRFDLLDGEMRRLIEELLLRLDKKNAKDSINQITAKAVLEPLLADTGMKFYVEYMRTGVKIHIRLNDRRKAQLYFSYPKVRKETDTIVSNILKFKELYDSFGSNSCITTFCSYEEKHFGT